MDKKLGTLVHALAMGLIAKHGVSGYDPDVAVLDLLCLHPEEITAPMSTTPYLLLKRYWEARKLAALPAPTMPMDNIGLSWQTVNKETAKRLKYHVSDLREHDVSTYLSFDALEMVARNLDWSADYNGLTEEEQARCDVFAAAYLSKCEQSGDLK